MWLLVLRIILPRLRRIVVATFDHLWSIFNMSARSAWMLPLHATPRPRQIAIGLHGRRTLVERWSGLPFWCMHAYRYSAAVRVNDTWLGVEPGCVSLFPPVVALEYRFRGPSTHTYAHFDLAPGPAGATAAPVMRQLGDAFERFDADFRQAVGWHAHQPARAAVRLWDLLWQYAGDEPTRTPGAGHAVVDRAVEWIELRLGEPIAISDVAEAMDVSHVHLVRLFRAHLGQTPLAYLHARRARRAEHFLKHTTRPMKAIAQEIGLSDLQQLNKLCRKVLGRPPSAVRRS
jgi:AraC family transcriptional regulator